MTVHRSGLMGTVDPGNPDAADYCSRSFAGCTLERTVVEVNGSNP